MQYGREMEERCIQWNNCELAKEYGCNMFFAPGQKQECPFKLVKAVPKNVQT